MPGHFDEPEGNVWGQAEEITPEMLASLNEPAAENAMTGGGEPSDPSATNDQKPDAGTLPGDGATATPTAAEQMEAWVKEQSDRFANGDTESVLYKPFQKNLSKMDRENQELRQQLVTQATQISQLFENLAELGDGTNILSATVIEALPDNLVSKLQTSLLQKQAANATAKLQRAQQVPVVAPVNEAVTTPPTGGPSPELRALMERADAEFVASRQAAARKAGVDPSKVTLDFGKPEDGVVARLAVFEASLDAAIKANEDVVLDSVRQRIPVGGTRTSGGTPPSIPNGESMLSRAARARTEAARKSGLFQ